MLLVFTLNSCTHVMVTVKNIIGKQTCYSSPNKWNLFFWEFLLFCRNTCGTSMIKRKLLKKKQKNNNSSILASRKMMMKNLRTWDKVSWKAASLLSSLKPKLDDQVCYQLLSDPGPLKLPGRTKRDFLISCFYHLKELKSNFSVQQAAWHNRLNVLSSRTAHEHERGQKWESRR